MWFYVFVHFGGKEPTLGNRRSGEVAVDREGGGVVRVRRVREGVRLGGTFWDRFASRRSRSYSPSEMRAWMSVMQSIYKIHPT